MVCGGIGGLLDVRVGVECAKFLLFFRFFLSVFRVWLVCGGVWWCVVCGGIVGLLDVRGGVECVWCKEGSVRFWCNWGSVRFWGK